MVDRGRRRESDEEEKRMMMVLSKLNQTDVVRCGSTSMSTGTKTGIGWRGCVSEGGGLRSISTSLQKFLSAPQYSVLVQQSKKELLWLSL